jgi:hypothetical protein
VIIRASIKEMIQEETNVNLLIRQMEEMSGAVIIMIKEKLSLCIFYEKRRKDINDKSTNIDRNLVLIIVN